MATMGHLFPSRTMLRGRMAPLTVAVVLASSLLLFLHSLPAVSAAGRVVIDESLAVPSPPVDEIVQNHRQLKAKNRVAEPTPVPPTPAPVPTAPRRPNVGLVFQPESRAVWPPKERTVHHPSRRTNISAPNPELIVAATPTATEGRRTGVASKPSQSQISAPIWRTVRP